MSIVPADDDILIHNWDIVHMVAHELWLQSLIPNAMAFSVRIAYLKGEDNESDVP